MATNRLSKLDKQVRQEWIDVIDIIFDIAEREGMSHSDLAKKAEISHTTVNNYYHEKFKYGPAGNCVAKLMFAVGIEWYNFIEAGVFEAIEDGVFTVPRLSKAA